MTTEAAKASAAGQSTRTLCQALALLNALPGSDEGQRARTVTIEVLCERHPEAQAAAEAWAASSVPWDLAGLDEAVFAAALTAIGA
jgi:hypothetical protein